MENGERGRGGECEEGGSMFKHKFSLIRPPKLYFSTLYTATKSSFMLLEITIGQDKYTADPHKRY
jgi:hypothetical protein